MKDQPEFHLRNVVAHHSQIEKSPPSLLTGYGARIILPKYPVPPASHNVVYPIPQNTRHNPQHITRPAPHSPNLPQNKYQRVGSRQQSLFLSLISRLSRIEINQHVKRVETRRVHVMSTQNPAGKHALQSGKQKNASSISLENKLDSAVAKTAYAVIQQNRMSFRLHNAKSAIAKSAQLSDPRSLLSGLTLHAVTDSRSFTYSEEHHSARS